MPVHVIADLGISTRRGMKTMLSNDKLLGLKFIDLDFSEDCVYRTQKKVSFSKVTKSPKVESVGPKAHHSSFDDDQLM